MNISSTSAAIGTTSVSQVSAAATPRTGSCESSQAPASDGSKLSRMGALMSKLQDLEQRDPSQAKQVLSSIAKQLHDKASSSSDPRMSALADKFQQAADTGNLSVLKPPAHGHGHHGHGGGHDAPPPAASPDPAAPDTSTASASYRKHGADPMQDVEAIVSGALDASSSVSTSTTATATTTA